MSSSKVNGKYYSPPSKRRKAKWLPVSQLLSKNEAALPINTKMSSKFSGCLLRLTSLDHLTYNVTLCARKCTAPRNFTFYLCAFVSVILEINQVLDRLIIQLVWYILKQLFTSVSVNIYLGASRFGKYINHYSPPPP